MKMSIGEKKILFVFGCPNREATVDRLYQVADLIPDPAGKKVVEALADKLEKVSQNLGGGEIGYSY